MPQLAKSALAILALCLSAAAAGAAPAVVDCSFQSGTRSSDLTIILPEKPSLLRGKPVELSVIPGASSREIGAIASKVDARTSEIGAPYIRVAFLLDEPNGFVAQIAGNGDAVSFIFDTKAQKPASDDRYLGTCHNIAPLLALFPN